GHNEYVVIISVKDNLGNLSVLAVLPALGVGGFAIYLVNQGIESWFSQRVSAALEGGRQVAEGYMDESGKSLKSDVLVLSRDTVWQLSPMLLGQNAMAGWLREQMREKRMDELALADAEGLIVASGSGLNRGVLPPEAMALLQAGSMGSGVVHLNDGKRMMALVALKNGWWLAAERDLNAAMLARIGGTAEAYNAYAELQANRAQLRVLVSLMVLLLLVATVALAVWAALRLANKIVQPVTELVHGTNRVSAGDLTVRLQPRDDDELGVLTQAFNRMTFQLAANRELLERKNHELDERRRFMEAVLTSVSTGVVAVDEGNVVRVANQRAFALLKLEVGSKLAKVVPEVSEVVREALRQLGECGVMGGVAGQGIAGQKSLLQHEVKVAVAEGDVRTLMLRLVPQPLGGVVLTFDDMT
ncbi:MAG: HAMP domain-containing protein, partial [Proteobacteria bacterium]|nr:HAMP domain-containing protein [Pseudomonadota bacterium]